MSSWHLLHKCPIPPPHLDGRPGPMASCSLLVASAGRQSKRPRQSSRQAGAGWFAGGRRGAYCPAPPDSVLPEPCYGCIIGYAASICAWHSQVYTQLEPEVYAPRCARGTRQPQAACSTFQQESVASGGGGRELAASVRSVWKAGGPRPFPRGAGADGEEFAVRVSLARCEGPTHGP